jgi:hypothetical protein
MRSALWAMVALLALSSASCGGGTDDSVGGAGGMGAGTAGDGGASGNTTCGNRIVESASGEQCEQGIQPTTTCATLSMGTGMVLCNSSCRLMMMCSGIVPVGGDGTGEGNGMAGSGG